MAERTHLLLIKYSSVVTHIHATMYIKTKNGYVYMGDFIVRTDEWEDVKKEIQADYECLDKQE